MYISKFAARVLRHLSRTEWKSVGELYRELQEEDLRKERMSWFLSIIAFFNSELAEILRGASIGGIYIALEELTSQGWAERRWRDESPEVLEKRGGNRRSEFRITEQGHRVRAYLSQVPEGSEDVISIPATA